MLVLHGLVLGQLDGAGHGAFDAQLVVHRRVEDQLQAVVVFFDGFRRILLGGLIDIPLDMQGFDIRDLHVAEGGDEMELHRRQVGAGIGAGLYIGTLVGLQARQGPRGKLFVTDHTGALYHHLHLIFTLERLGLLLGVPQAFAAVERAADGLSGDGVFSEVQFIFKALLFFCHG